MDEQSAIEFSIETFNDIKRLLKLESFVVEIMCDLVDKNTKQRNNYELVSISFGPIKLYGSNKGLSANKNVYMYSGNYLSRCL